MRQTSSSAAVSDRVPDARMPDARMLAAHTPAAHTPAALISAAHVPAAATPTYRQPAASASLPMAALLALTMCSFIATANETVPAGLLPQIADDFGVSEAWAGQLVTLLSLIHI